MRFEIIGLIPARSGSKRIPGKNIKPLCGKPLIEYTIEAAIDSKIFGGIYVSSDSMAVKEITDHHKIGFIRRPQEISGDRSPDREWIDHALKWLHPSFSYFAILRPTSPFRTGDTIRRAWSEWDRRSILKAVEPVLQRPEKMWRVKADRMVNYIGKDLHLEQSSVFEPIYAQNASLELRPAFTDPQAYQPFFTVGHEGLDINTPEDFEYAEWLMQKGVK